MLWRRPKGLKKVKMDYTDSQLLFSLLGYADALNDISIISSLSDFYLKVLLYCKSKAKNILQADRVFKEFISYFFEETLIYDIETEEIFIN